MHAVSKRDVYLIIVGAVSGSDGFPAYRINESAVDEDSGFAAVISAANAGTLPVFENNVREFRFDI